MRSDEAAPISRQPGWIRNPVIQSLALGVAMFGALAAWELANGHRGGFVELLFSGGHPGTMLVMIVLTSFTWGANRHSHISFRRDLALLAPQLRSTPEEREAVFARHDFSDGAGSKIAGWIASLLGALVIADPDTNIPRLFASQPWNHDFLAALVINGSLFWLIGRGAFRSIQIGRLIASLSPIMPRVDLLDLRSYAPFARHGLRTAFLWLGGSSIASLIFLNQNRDLMTAAVISGTVGLGIYSLLQPLRGAHETIVHAKEQELERIRETIRACREELLNDRVDGASSAAQRMPGLLAYEERIATVREWPLDLPTFLRFTLLVSLAVGSWLGGAVVELLLGSALGN